MEAAFLFHGVHAERGEERRIKMNARRIVPPPQGGRHCPPRTAGRPFPRAGRPPHLGGTRYYTRGPQKQKATLGRSPGDLRKRGNGSVYARVVSQRRRLTGGRRAQSERSGLRPRTAIYTPSLWIRRLHRALHVSPPGCSDGLTARRTADGTTAAASIDVVPPGDCGARTGRKGPADNRARSPHPLRSAMCVHGA